jgi:hypothetical protein
VQERVDHRAETSAPEGFSKHLLDYFELKTLTNTIRLKLTTFTRQKKPSTLAGVPLLPWILHACFPREGG